MFGPEPTGPLYDAWSLRDWGGRYEAAASFSVDCKVHRSQFLALAVGALVPRCGASSAVRHLPRPVLRDPLHSLWACGVCRVCRELGLTLRAAVPRPPNREALVHVFLGLSQSGGVVRSGCRLAHDPRGPRILGALGHDRFLAVERVNRVPNRYSIIDGAGGLTVPALHDGIESAVCNTMWIALHWSYGMRIWRVVRGQLGGELELRDLQHRLQHGPTFEGEDPSRSNTLVFPALRKPGGPCVIFVDMEQTFTNRLFSVVRVIDVPDGACGCDCPGLCPGLCMCVGTDVYTISCTRTQHIICNLGTGKTTTFTRPCFLEVVGREHVCVHKGTALYVYHVADLANPCMSFPSFGPLQSNPQLGRATGIIAVPAVPYTERPQYQPLVPVPEAGTTFAVSFGIFDVTTSLKIGDVEVKWVKSGGKPTWRLSPEKPLSLYC